jgi:hypothetical protein
MPEKTKTYKLEYFKQGSYYSSGSDRRRFLTMDYNMESYIGVVGVGVIGGWTIESVSGLIIQIIPGSGVASGYYVESPYVIKQRSEMVAGDREVSTIPSPDGTPEENLTVSERAIYVSVIQLYDSSFNPVGDIENAYVKVVIPTILTLSDDSDTYIYAERPSGATPYPLLNDYPPLPGPPPVRSDYANYDEYQVALDAYQAKLDAIHNYQWYTNPDNHFTEVDFIKSGTKTIASSKICLGRVVTRGGEVSKIDTTDVDNIANLYSQIKKYATEILVEHRHGGSKSFDSPRIRLETDIRQCSLYSYDSVAGRSKFSVMTKVETSIELGHKHTYEIDSDGNGQTIDQTGSTESHFHKITNEIVGNPEESVNTVKNHIHTIETSSEQGDTWTSESPYVIYVNDEIFGDETSTNITVDADAQTIVFENGVGASYSKYSTSFPIYGVTYEYSAREVSVSSFMLKMILDFEDTFESILTPQTTRLEGGDLTVTAAEEQRYNEALSQNPFRFTDEDGNLVGLTDLLSQSTTAQALLKEEGDRFTFTPNAAQDITITLEELGKVDKVSIEILGNVEVTGVLRPESIIYLNANKILTGEFIPEVIPFISHIGRLEEQLLPFQHPLVSDDAVRYQAVPIITDTTLGHYHKLFIGKDWSGATSDTLVSDSPVYYQEDDNDNVYFIAHAHGVTDGTIAATEKIGLLNWQNNVSSEVLTTSLHTHNMIVPSIGNGKLIYAIKEDINGNIYVGTSDGFIVIPDANAYQFVMNGVDLYFYGDNLWDLLKEARLQYEKETENPFFLTESVYLPQIEVAEETLLVDGDSVLLENTIEPDREGDQVMIKKISFFKMPNFRYLQEKN